MTTDQAGSAARRRCPSPIPAILARKAEIVAALQEALAPDAVINDPAEVRAYERRAYRVSARRCGGAAASTEEVAAVLPYLPRGGRPGGAAGAGTASRAGHCRWPMRCSG